MKRFWILPLIILPVILGIVKINIPPQPVETLQAINPYLESSISYETFSKEEQGWGYSVFLDGKLYVKTGDLMDKKSFFESEEEAVLHAERLIRKIRKKGFLLGDD